MHTDPLIAQYEQWVYPEPITDLAAYVAFGGHDFADPSRMRRKIWPRPIEPTNLNILVAGCGANQAAILAQANPTSQVFAIDLSAEAIANHKRLKDACQLDNLQVQLLAVEEVARTGHQFDYIVSTGVLHHLSKPEAGLKALREVLAPHGAISLMLYGKNRRAGVYMVQEALRTLGTTRTPEGLKLTRDVVSRLPAWHHACQYVQIAPDLDYDAGIVDTFLNARDRAYTVPEIFDLVQTCKLRFQSWLDGLAYSAAATFPADAIIHDHIEQLTPQEQWHVVDLLAQVTGAHRFLLCHQERDQDSYTPDFTDTAWLDYVPHVHPDLLCERKDDQATLARDWHRFNLAGDTLACFMSINGTLTFREIIANTHDQEHRKYLAAAFAQLVEWDHIYCELR